MKKPHCESCGRELGYVEITSFSDREPRYAATERCDCGGYCPLCDHQLELGKCWNTDCVLVGQVAP